MSLYYRVCVPSVAHLKLSIAGTTLITIHSQLDGRDEGIAAKDAITLMPPQWQRHQERTGAAVLSPFEHAAF